MRHLMTETWDNYFLDPRNAPDPDDEWLDGCSAHAMIRTDRAISHEDPSVLQVWRLRASSLAAERIGLSRRPAKLLLHLLRFHGF